MPVPKTQEPFPGLVGSRTDGWLPVFVRLPYQLVGFDLGPGFLSKGLFAFLFEAFGLGQQQAGLLLFREFFGHTARISSSSTVLVVIVFGEFGLFVAAAVAIAAIAVVVAVYYSELKCLLGCGNRRKKDESDSIASGLRKGQGLGHGQCVVVVCSNHSYQIGTQEKLYGGSTKETRLQLWIVEFERSVFRTGVSGESALLWIDRVFENDRQCFELHENIEISNSNRMISG